MGRGGGGKKEGGREGGMKTGRKRGRKWREREKRILGLPGAALPKPNPAPCSLNVCFSSK